MTRKSSPLGIWAALALFAFPVVIALGAPWLARHRTDPLEKEFEKP